MILFPPVAPVLIHKTRKGGSTILIVIFFMTFFMAVGGEIFLYSSKRDKSEQDSVPPIIKQMLRLNEDIKKVMDAEREFDYENLLESLGKILKGEKSPYVVVNLLNTNSDLTRRRVLFTFASAKHERLLSLLDERDYDKIEIIVPKSPSARNKVAKIAAEVAARKFSYTDITLCA